MGPAPVVTPGPTPVVDPAPTPVPAPAPAAVPTTGGDIQEPRRSLRERREPERLIARSGKMHADAVKAVKRNLWEDGEEASDIPLNRHVKSGVPRLLGHALPPLQ